MRESIGASMLLYLVVIFSSLIILVFVSILSYSKAYKVKNRIIEIIEKYEYYSRSSDIAINEINPDLSMAGYNSSNPKCENIQRRLKEKYNIVSPNLNNNGYNYCVFWVPKDENEGMNGIGHYVVTTFIHFEIPIIGDVLTFPVYGETKTLGKVYDY